ncbi:putative Rossmann fold nucleotide-binding protein DprA/Smf involved in DNA uptake [Brevibacterium epidermidis]|jgi:DNA processing protein|uniref:Rossmann fold nucleotide-binding protein DprA/Smf involved in DNA uptake n=1 Tax=Brevibacterium epidermidis TaxID=1698 RepID=A0ABV4EGY1_BREEP
MIAVLAGGVDRPCPAGNRDLLDQVADVGLVVSEVPPGETPSRHGFQARGRLMAALSNITILVEAGTRSGAMRLAEQAHDLGRRVGAVPGPVTSATNTGPHRLLQERRGEIVTDASQTINMLHMTEALNEAPTGSLIPSRFRSAPAQQRSTDTPTL